MTKSQGVLFLAVLAFGLSACNDYSTPKGVLGTAYKALKENKLKTFRKTLDGSALKEYGDELGMAKLQELIQSKELMPGNETLMQSEVDFYGRLVKQVFNVPVLARNEGESSSPFEPFWTSQIHCESRYYYNARPGWRRTPGDPFYPFPGDPICSVPGPNPPGYCDGYYTRVTHCRILELNLNVD